MMKFPIYGKIKNVPNHKPDIYCTIICIFEATSAEASETLEVGQLDTAAFPPKLVDVF
jgi:hypothetical protein